MMRQKGLRGLRGEGGELSFMKRAAVTALLMASAATAAAKADLIETARPPMVCTPHSCIDPRTGDYTQSECDAAGCRQLGGVLGRVSPQERARLLRERGGFSCNRNRCIERGSGAVWESTCDNEGCRPLAPVRRR